MLRTAALATLSLLLGLTLGPGALSAPASSGAVAAASADLPRYQPWGSTRAPDQRLRRGCRYYKYRYAVNPPSNDWTAEIFLIDPDGERLAHAALAPGADRATGTRYWRICRAATRAGRFKMRMKVTWWDRYEDHVGWVRPGYFRLYRGR